MTRRWRIFFIGLAVLLIAILGTVYYIIPVGNTFAAKTMCSCVFVAGMEEAKVREVELATLEMFRVEVDHEQQRTQGSLWGLRPRTVIYRPGMGCTVVAGADPDQLQSQTYPAPQRYLAAADTAYWPRGNRDTLPTPSGIQQDQLDSVVNQLFIEDQPTGRKNTRAVVVVHQDKIVAEQYAEGFDAHSLLRGWSMTKSVINALLGILVRERSFDIYAPAPVPEWQSPEDPRRAITTDMLLRMSSGLSFLEFYGFRTDATEMLFLSQDAGAYAAQADLDHPPDTEWSYSSGTTNILSRLIKQQFNHYEDYLSFPYRALFGPLGMERVVMEPDASGTFVGSSFMWATARDWARFGMLYLHDGVWQGQRILPEGWVSYSATPTSTAPSGIYGAQFWTPTSEAIEGRYQHWRWADVPTDAFAAEGFEGQMVCVIPSRQTVIVRLGVTHDRSTWSMPEFVAEVLACLPHAGEDGIPPT